MTKTATRKNGITEVLSTPIIYQTKLFKADGMNVLAPEPMEVGPHVKQKRLTHNQRAVQKTEPEVVVQLLKDWSLEVCVNGWDLGL